MTRNPGFPISLDVQGRLCLVLGGDDEAAEKVQRLLDAGAKVTVINPTLNDALRKLAAGAKVIHRPRLFRANDADGAVLIINTLTKDAEYSQSVLDVARKERVVLCSVDQPEASTAFLPAVVSQGPLRIAISTSGASPALARRLRENLSAIFDERFGRFLDWLGTLREQVQQGEPDIERRRAQLRQTVEGFAVTGSVRYPDGWEAAAAAPPEPPRAAPQPPPQASSTKIRIS
ncbi:MAG TPA: bifunctional precorrin-2 dehydrogenase/sirohydrochlorin ferrochelatase [Nitrospirales bacterium]|nr:bifunctional precorrin-2 dehydrogenase/sirohydrochlorin ferrochelatase [Nitrospirales bacterium]